MELQIALLNENAFICSLPPPAELTKQKQLWAFAEQLNSAPFVEEIVIGMNNLTLFLHYGENLAACQQAVQKQWATHILSTTQRSQLFSIPVIYGGKVGEDLAFVADFHHLTVDELIAQHTAPAYTVFMIGFQAGFPYLGGLPPSLHTPRRATPRTRIPAGAVGIGGSQTGIYPFSSPGGWQLIGHTPFVLFDKYAPQPTTLKPGDQVQFVAESVVL